MVPAATGSSGLVQHAIAQTHHRQTAASPCGSSAALRMARRHQSAAAPASHRSAAGLATVGRGTWKIHAGCRRHHRPLGRPASLLRRQAARHRHDGAAGRHRRHILTAQGVPVRLPGASLSLTLSLESLLTHGAHGSLRASLGSSMAPLAASGAGVRRLTRSPGWQAIGWTGSGVGRAGQARRQADCCCCRCIAAV